MTNVHDSIAVHLAAWEWFVLLGWINAQDQRPMDTVIQRLSDQVLQGPAQ